MQNEIEDYRSALLEEGNQSDFVKNRLSKFGLKGAAGTNEQTDRRSTMAIKRALQNLDEDINVDDFLSQELETEYM